MTTALSEHRLRGVHVYGDPAAFVRRRHDIVVVLSHQARPDVHLSKSLRIPSHLSYALPGRSSPPPPLPCRIIFPCCKCCVRRNWDWDSHGAWLPLWSRNLILWLSWAIQAFPNVPCLDSYETPLHKLCLPLFFIFLGKRCRAIGLPSDRALTYKYIIFPIRLVTYNQGRCCPLSVRPLSTKIKYLSSSSCSLAASCPLQLTRLGSYKFSLSRTAKWHFAKKSWRPSFVPIHKYLPRD